MNYNNNYNTYNNSFISGKFVIIEEEQSIARCVGNNLDVISGYLTKIWKEFYIFGRKMVSEESIYFNQENGI